MSKYLSIITREIAIKGKLTNIICWPVRNNEFGLSIGFIVIWSLACSIDSYLLMASIKKSISITALALSSISGMLLNVCCMLALAFIVNLIIVHFNTYSSKIATGRTIFLLGNSCAYPVLLMTANIILFQSLFISGFALVLQQTLFAYYLFMDLKAAHILIAFVIAEVIVYVVLQPALIYCVSICLQLAILLIK